ncbi:MAG: hypothetical protein LHV68_11295 [Elusimicrobia bacterium]|nr:hypothetical protein [Candidatus Liberimonas magnetica]
MKHTKIILLFILVLLQAVGIFLSAYALNISANKNLSDSFSGSKIEVHGLLSILVVVKSSVEEQLKTITELACLPLGYQKTSDKTGDNKNNSTPSSSFPSNKISLNTQNTNVNILNFNLKYQNPSSRIENIFSGIVIINLFWIIEFLILFKLKKLKNYYFILARASIDFILRGKVYLNPVANYRQQGFFFVYGKKYV